jgi:hypothetical protein
MWDGSIPERRYAIFSDTLGGLHLAVVTGEDLCGAENSSNFIQWVGGLRPAEKRDINKHKKEVVK